MKVLVLYEHPAPSSGLAIQGDLLFRGLREIGVEAQAAHYESSSEKEWYYRWFQPDIVVGIGYWGYIPDIILHPQAHHRLAVPWLVADGYIAKYQRELNDLPLILTTSQWVKDVYIRDGICGDHIEVLPVGCDTDFFHPYSTDDPQVLEIRAMLGIRPDQLMILTAGGDAASKGAQEVMQALALLQGKVPDWVYVAKVWPQERTRRQNEEDLRLACSLGIQDRYRIVMDKASREYMTALISACDIYAAPSRLEGFGMGQVEANACGKPVVSLNAMGMVDTLVHGKTALLASVGVEHTVDRVTVEAESGHHRTRTIVFRHPRIVDYRASIEDLAKNLQILMNDPDMRKCMGAAGRENVVGHFDYRIVARRLVQIVRERLGL
jgi:glycosyltransferase involved in cell wall biosynthesis